MQTISASSLVLLTFCSTLALAQTSSPQYQLKQVTLSTPAKTAKQSALQGRYRVQVD
jgi:hypothetical protein